MSDFSGLDIFSPKDTEIVANLPRAIRETRKSIAMIKVLNAKFEYGTVRGDLVFPEKSTGIWLRTKADLSDRQVFFGVAFPEDNAVVVGATAYCPDWHWQSGELLYLSTSYGKLTTIPHNEELPIAGYAITDKLVVFNIFSQQTLAVLDDFKDWLAGQKIEITSTVEWIKQQIIIFTNTLEELEAMQKALEDLAKLVQDRLDEAMPILDEIAHTFTYIMDRQDDNSLEYEVGAFYTVPRYVPEKSIITMQVNGVTFHEFEKVPAISPDIESETVILNAAIPAGTRIYTLVMGFPVKQGIPDAVAHDASLEGTGTPIDPLKVAIRTFPSMAKAWGVWNYDGTEDSSYNVASVTQVTTQRYRVSFTEFLEDTQYVVLPTVNSPAPSGYVAQFEGRTAGSFIINLSAPLSEGQQLTFVVF